MNEHRLTRTRWLALLFGMLVAAAASAQHLAQGQHSHAPKRSVTIESPWARASPGTAPNGAVFMSIANHGQSAVWFAGGTTEVASKVEIHTHVNDNGILRMRRIKRLALPAGKTVELKPGGYHVMLLGLHEQLKKGDSFDLELNFENAESQTVKVGILGVGAMGAENHQSGSHGH